jgi:hypothetical protein
MSTNPKSADYRPLTEGESEGRALRRAHAVTQATEATAGESGRQDGQKGKDAVLRSQK